MYPAPFIVLERPRYEKAEGNCRKGQEVSNAFGGVIDPMPSLVLLLLLEDLSMELVSTVVAAAAQYA